MERIIEEDTTAIEGYASILFNRIGEIRQGLGDATLSREQAKERLNDFKQQAAAIVVLLNEMERAIS